MKKCCTALLISFMVLLTLMPSLSLADGGRIDKIDANNAMSGIEALCNSSFEGRQSGTKGNYLAAQWISKQFEALSLKPYKENSYLQPFVTSYYEILPPLELSLQKDDAWHALEYQEDFVVFPGSGEAQLEGELVFTGYGITYEAIGYDDYENIDVKGKIAVINDLHYNPIPRPPEMDDDPYEYRLQNALAHGAKGIIFVAQIGSFNKMMRRMMDRKRVHTLFQDNAPIPVLYIREKVFDQLLSPETSLNDIYEWVQEHQQPFELKLNTKAQINVTIDTMPRASHNVIGYIPAVKENTQKSIVIGTQYDHLGKDLINQDIYHGAVWSASGIALMLEIARILQESSWASNYHIVFIAFSGNETNLEGSRHYLHHPLFPVKDIQLMFNFNAVGTILCSNWMIISNTYEYHPVAYRDLIKHSKAYLSHEHRLIDLTRDHLYQSARLPIDADTFHQSKVPFIYIFAYDACYEWQYFRTPRDTPDIISPELIRESGNFLLQLIQLSLD